MEAELTNFTPPRLSSTNNSPYQALVIRYALLRTLIRQPEFEMAKDTLLETVQDWQRQIIDEFEADTFDDTDELLHLSQAAIDRGNDIDDSELHMIYRYMEFHNRAQKWKHEYYTWQDVFERLSTLDRFPKVSRSEKPEHALDTIEKGCGRSRNRRSSMRSSTRSEAMSSASPRTTPSSSRLSPDTGGRTASRHR